MTLTVIWNGQVFSPQPQGVTSLLIGGGQVIRLGQLDVSLLQASGLVENVIDAQGCLVFPGLIDPHQHLVGAGGEEGFASRMPEMPLREIILAGITTVVGLLGTDTVTRNPVSLYAKVQQLNAEGITAYMYTGGFELPPHTIMASPLEDIVMIDPVIGTGEIAISDPRWIDPQLYNLAYVISQTQLAGQMAGKAGVTHIHTGPSEKRLSLLHQILDEYAIKPESIYATHITRSPELMRDAVSLAARGAYVDMDTVDGGIPDHLHHYLQAGGDPNHVTVSSDSYTPGGSPAKFWQAFADCWRDDRLTATQVLKAFCVNTAKVLKLNQKGHLHPGADADVLIVREETMKITHLLAGGKLLIENAQQVHKGEQDRLLKQGVVE
ncbi:MAG: beta-aspartyl-peptidase [Anaerolineae bacterium]